MSAPHLPNRQGSGGKSRSAKTPPQLRKISSTRYAIGYHRPKSLKTKSRGELRQPLLDGDQSPDEKAPLCDFSKDLSETFKLIKGSWVNLLLVFVPFGVAAHFAKWDATVIFFLNFLGMIPLASVLGDATECLAEHLGETIGGLLNATFGNAVEIVVMVLALVHAKQNEDQKETLLDVVQTSLIGSIFSNSLLVLGCAFVANGYYYKESSFNVTATSANVSLLMISAFVMLLPGAYTANQDKEDILMVSRAAAIILMLMYCCLLVFVLFTHKDIMNAEAQDVEQPQKAVNQLLLQHSVKSIKEESEDLDLHTDSDFNEIGDSGQVVKSAVDMHQNSGDMEPLGEEEEEDDDDEAELTLFGSLVLLLIATLLVSWLSEYLVDSITEMANDLNMEPAFVGIILLPIIGNAVEHITAIRMAVRNKMDIALSIAIGSATQVAMFVVSLAVLVGWMIDLPLSLAFDPFEINLFIYSSIIIFATISDGSSNWLEGVMLLGLYALIAIAVWHQSYCSGYNEADGICGPGATPTPTMGF
eukprot:CAMPEP_0201568156 /NCGR_PEP_ID=MMETSP0190_2-20130828/9070_1 /ASSEMBLY_ACC=CAM_ASM_000263 /TAXON_ID=37353 /ORGANISM="Rosalina sp." /LENGTH=530 /DNA_ID=CAMNT_0047988971 /DNA_START=217 /DNA_END=1809 /DNA_ORIENTATION=-